MRIVHVVLGRANPNRMNGVNRVVHNLATAQVNEGYHVSVWGITNSYNKEDDLSRVYYTNWFKPKGKFGVDELLKNEIVDQPEGTCFHLHGGFIPVFYSLSKLFSSYKKRFVLTPHGTYTVGAMQGNNLLKRLYFRFLEKTIINKANKIQCLGHSEESDLRNLTNKATISLIPNGQNFDELKADGQLPSSNFVIGFCGRISRWHKGLDILLDSFIHYKKYLKGSGSLHLVGDGEYLQTMKDLTIKSGVENDVVFHGKQFGSQKIRVLKSMDVFVHTSRNEGLPTAVIEAAALSKPCIVTKMTSMDRYVRIYEAGWTTDTLDIEKIALLFLDAEKEYNDGSLTIKAENALLMAKENFDWTIIAKQTYVMYAA